MVEGVTISQISLVVDDNGIETARMRSRIKLLAEVGEGVHNGERCQEDGVISHELAGFHDLDNCPSLQVILKSRWDVQF